MGLLYLLLCQNKNHSELCKNKIPHTSPAATNKHTHTQIQFQRIEDEIRFIYKKKQYLNPSRIVFDDANLSIHHRINRLFCIKAGCSGNRGGELTAVTLLVVPLVITTIRPLIFVVPQHCFLSITTKHFSTEELNHYTKHGKEHV
jgi:hypothetical protein